MKRAVCLLIFVLILAYGWPSSAQEEGSVFIELENGSLLSPSGVEYAFLANEGILYYLAEDEMVFVGTVQGEEAFSKHMLETYQTGLFALGSRDNDDILLRRLPDNEWISFYRKASLPAFDFSVDNCIRLEFVSGIGVAEKDAMHVNCQGGITDKAEIAQFLSDIRSQDDPINAGLYDLVRKPEGMLEHCYIMGVIYGFFAEEPNLVKQMFVISYNDLAYSVDMSYVLPEEWLQKLIDSGCGG